MWALYHGTHAFSTSSITKTIKEKLAGTYDRTGNIASQFSNLLSGGFDQLGYIPISEAIEQCQGIARPEVERAIQQ